MKNNNMRRSLRVALMGTLALGAATAVWAGTTATKITSDSGTNDPSISSDGVHKVPKSADFEGSLDPRAETYFTDKVTSNSTEKWSFKANYFVSSAKRTTIAQWLQRDPSKTGADLRKPVMFLTAYKGSDGKLSICNSNSSTASGCNLWTGVPDGFLLDMSGDGKSAKVTINGQTKTLSLIKTPSGIDRTNGDLELRWGAYHHDTDSNGAASTAQVRVYNISETGFD
jgi:hypothetical protein